MKNNITKKTIPPYVDYYSMHRDPFTTEIQPDLFYDEPSRKQRLGTLQHLTQFGNELMIVTGQKGSGKTTMLHQFISISPKLWKFAIIDAQHGLDERKILQQIFRQMGMEFKGATHADLLNQMKVQFELLQRKGIYCVMLIDNADQLPVTAIKKVMEMASFISSVNKPILRIALFGKDELTNKLDDPILSEYSQLPQRTMELQPFTEDQTSQYVLGRLAAAHFVSTELFTPSVLHKLYTESYGWPARINEAAQDILLNSLPKDKQKLSQGLNKNDIHLSRYIGLSMIAGIVITYFLFQDEIGQWSKNIISSDTNDSAMASSTQNSTTNPLNKIYNKPKNINQGISNDTTQKPATTLVEKLKQRNPDYLSKNNAIQAKKAVATDPISVTKNKPDIKNPKTVNTPKATVNIASIPRKEKWIFEQNARYYTLQIVAGENLKTIEEFIAEHKLKNNIAFYRSVRNGKPWYGLVYGVYTHKQAATSAINQLSNRLQRLKPWVRSIGSIQNDINKTRPTG